jgi:hypothetical protein
MIPEMEEHFEGVTGKKFKSINMKTNPAIKKLQI